MRRFAVLFVGLTMALPAAPALASHSVVDVEVRFSVVNQAEADPACPHPDAAGVNREYELVADLVAPRVPLRKGLITGVSLYLAGSGTPGPLLWHLKDPPGYDYATKQAQDGHASVILDPLGYGRSTWPSNGFEICPLSEAYMFDQVIADLKAGTYRIAGPLEPVSFERVALVGHSLGAIRAQLTAYEFPKARNPDNLDALVVAGWSDSALIPLAVTVGDIEVLGGLPFVYQAVAENRAECAQFDVLGGGPKQDGHGSSGYAYLFKTGQDQTGQDRDDWTPLTATASDDVLEAFKARYEKDPCGSMDIGGVLTQNQYRLREIDVPVLHVYSDLEEKAFLDADGQQGRYEGSDDASRYVIRNSGHLYTLEAGREAFRSAMSGWFKARGF